MELKVLGCFGPYPAPGQACSGYLLKSGRHSILLDCGNGVLSQLLYLANPRDLDAVVLSHLHSDHVSDLFILRYCLQMNGEEAGPLTVYAPGEPLEEFNRLTYKTYLQATAVSDLDVIRVGDFTIRFNSGIHAVPSHIITVENEGRKLVYSGDTEYFPELADIAKDADLFLCEANYEKKDIEAGQKNHLAAFQAARVAAEANVKRLVITHHHPRKNLEQVLLEAGREFPAVQAAKAGDLYII